MVADMKSYLVDMPPSPPPLTLIDDFDTRRCRFTTFGSAGVGNMKRMEVYYLTKENILVKPVITTTKLRVPFDTKPYPGSDTLNLVMNLPESSNLFHTLRRLDGLVLAVVHHVANETKPNQSMEVIEALQTKLLNIRADAKYDATFKMKLSPKTPIKNITSREDIAAQNLLQGDAYAQFALSQVWLMPNQTFGLQARALRVKWMPFVSSMTSLGDWTVPEEAAPSLTSQFSD